MKSVNNGTRIVAEDHLFEIMESNVKFNEFVGQCITHFMHFVIPRRDQTKEICQDYRAPLDIEDAGGNVVMLTRKDSSNLIYIEFWKW